MLKFKVLKLKKKKLIKFTKFNILIKEYNCDYKKYNCNKSILERVIL